MAGRGYNSSICDHCEDLSPTLVIPDHFSSSQSSTIVIIYDEPVGSLQDQVIFIFPGEVGGLLKKVVPQRVDRRTFIIKTPIYNVSKRGFVFVTPQVKFASGQLKEMADIKISLKHPVRSVMELCLRLSTQDAVLPVLLALVIHSKETGHENNSEDYQMFQDAHFERIMATLVGSMEPGTKYLHEVLLPNKKWKKSSLEDFARRYKMSEMEKQAYMLSKRVKAKRKEMIVKGECQGQSDDAKEKNPLQPLRQTQLSTSTPEISHIMNELGSRRQQRPGISPSHSTGVRMQPWSSKKKTQSFQDDGPHCDRACPSSNCGEECISEADAVPMPSVYDMTNFDEDEEPELQAANTGTNEKKKNLKKPIITNSSMSSGLTSRLKLSLSNPNQTTLKVPEIPKGDDEDTWSLDSYEDMNQMDDEYEDDISRCELTPVAFTSHRTNKPSPPIMHSLSTRPQLPVPVDAFSATSPHTKCSSFRAKKRGIVTAGAGSKPSLRPPVPVSESSQQPKGTRTAKATQAFGKQDVGVAVSSGGKSLGGARPNAEKNTLGFENPHLYDAPDTANAVKKAFMFKKELSTSSITPAATKSSTQDLVQYENVIKQSQTQPPALPPPLPLHPPPSYPPSIPQCAIPAPCTKPKGATMTKVETEPLPGTQPKTAVKGMSHLPRQPADHKQLSELSALFLTRGSADGRRGGDGRRTAPTAPNGPHVAGMSYSLH